MIHTTIGIFPSVDKAQAAVDILLQNGFRQEFIKMISREGDNSLETQDKYERGLHDYFKDILNNAEDIERYTSVASQGVVVSVQGDNYGQASRAAELLDRCGTIPVETKAQSLRHGYQEHERLNTVDDEDDRTKQYHPESHVDRENASADQQTRPARITETITTRRTYIVESPLSRDVHKETHLKVEEQGGNREADSGEVLK